MSTARRLPERSIRQLHGSSLAPYEDAFARYLDERDYPYQTTTTYFGCLAHFGRWMDRRPLPVASLDEDRIAEFLDDHLPQCDCAAPVVRTREDLSAALGHLFVVLRAETAIPEKTKSRCQSPKVAGFGSGWLRCWAWVLADKR